MAATLRNAGKTQSVQRSNWVPTVSVKRMFSFKMAGERAQQRDFGAAAIAAAEFTQGETAAGACARLAALVPRIGDRRSLRPLAVDAAENGVCRLPDISPLIRALVNARRGADVEAAALLCRMLDTAPSERERLASAISSSLKAEMVEWRVRAGVRAWVRTLAVAFPVVASWQLVAGPVSLNDGILLAVLRILGVAAVVALATTIVAFPLWPLFLGISARMDAPRRRRVGYRVRALTNLGAPAASCVCARLIPSAMLRPVAVGGVAASLALLTEDVATSVTAEDLFALLRVVHILPRRYAAELVQAVGRVGSSQVVPTLRKLSSRWPDGTPVRDDITRVCRRAIQEIERRAAPLEARRTLLRAATPGPPAESLLRAALEDTSAVAEQMLRPSENGT
ncbi:MAG: hypothetical protein KGJ62_00270 [Armatimonadetes bacterium]|nr:hypothetical protein [Armatimonadota bacterium]